MWCRCTFQAAPNSNAPCAHGCVHMQLMLMQSYAVTCDHMQPCKFHAVQCTNAVPCGPCSHMQSHADTCSHLSVSFTDPELGSWCRAWGWFNAAVHAVPCDFAHIMLSARFMKYIEVFRYLGIRLRVFRQNSTPCTHLVLHN